MGLIEGIEHSMQEVRDSQKNAVQWADLMAGFVGIEELTAENLNLLVERIEVFERMETEAGAEQVIKVCYRFGGYIQERRFKATMLIRHGRRRKCPLGKGAGDKKAPSVS